MTSPAAGLIGRLVRIQLVAWGTAGLLVAAFAPRLLLLDPTVVHGSARIAVIGWVATLLLVVVATLVVGHGVRPLLAAFVGSFARFRRSGADPVGSFARFSLADPDD